MNVKWKSATYEEACCLRIGVKSEVRVYENDRDAPMKLWSPDLRCSRFDTNGEKERRL